MTPRRAPDPPAHLSRRAKSWWRSVVVEFELGEHHLHLLRLACEALDRADAAREALTAHGPTFTDRFGQPRARPELAIARDSAVLYARLVRELGFDAEQVPDRRLLINRLRYQKGGRS